MTDRDRLRELAEKATPGPWVPDFIEPVEDDYPETGWFREGPGQIHVGDYNTLSGNDAAYIAAASPDVILALLEERRVLREIRDAALAYRNLVFGHASESDQLEAWALLDNMFLGQGEPYPAERADHEHYWVDARDDETGWHCTVCGVTEYPGEEFDPDDEVALQAEPARAEEGAS